MNLLLRFKTNYCLLHAFQNQASSQQPSSRNKVKNVEKNHATIVASKKSASFWDQVVEENKPAPKPTPSRAVQKVEKPKQTAIQGQVGH